MSGDPTPTRYTRVLALATLALVLLSWPLWLDDRPYPRVPFIRNGPALAWLPHATSLSLLLPLVRPGGRLVLVPALGLVGLSVLGDQDRLQPWVYQFLVLGLALSAAPADWAVRLARWFHAAMYFHSGLSKLDRTFARELGRSFLSVPARAWDLDLSRLPDPVLDALALSMPAAEILLAAFLLIPRARLLGLGFAATLHLGILAILGPWGLDHGATVLVWNVALLVEESLLLQPRTEPLHPADWARLSLPLRILCGGVAILPFLERLGLWDTWPSFAVYASHNERAEIYLHAEDHSRWPAVIRPHLLDLGDPPWLRLDLVAWSRASRGVPPYPQVRTTLGVARGLLAGDSAPRTIRVIIRGRADRWTGRRSELTIQGREALERRLRSLPPQRLAGPNRPCP